MTLDNMLQDQAMLLRDLARHPTNDAPIRDQLLALARRCEELAEGREWVLASSKAAAVEHTTNTAAQPIRAGALDRMSSAPFPGASEMLHRVIAESRADKGNLQLLHAGSQTLRIVASEGFEAPFLNYFCEVEASDNSACGSALKTGTEIVVTDTNISPIFVGKESGEVLRAAGVRAVLSVPLIARSGALLGVVSVHRRQVWHPSDGELRRAADIARMLASTVETLLPNWGEVA